MFLIDDYPKTVPKDVVVSVKGLCVPVAKDDWSLVLFLADRSASRLKHLAPHCRARAMVPQIHDMALFLLEQANMAPGCRRPYSQVQRIASLIRQDLDVIRMLESEDGDALEDLDECARANGAGKSSERRVKSRAARAAMSYGDAAGLLVYMHADIMAAASNLWLDLAAGRLDPLDVADQFRLMAAAALLLEGCASDRRCS